MSPCLERRGGESRPVQRAGPRDEEQARDETSAAGIVFMVLRRRLGPKHPKVKAELVSTSPLGSGRSIACGHRHSRSCSHEHGLGWLGNGRIAATRASPYEYGSRRVRAVNAVITHVPHVAWACNDPTLAGPLQACPHRKLRENPAYSPPGLRELPAHR